MKKRISLAAVLVMLILCFAAMAQASESAPCAHSWTCTERLESTCTRHGWEKYVCGLCGAVNNANLPIKQHTWVKTYTKEPTCTQEGYDHYQCTSCNATQRWDIEKSAHRYGSWRVTAEATCTLEGLRECYCRDCGARAVDVTKKLPHPYGEWNVLRETTDRSMGLRERICTVCSHRETEEFYPQGTLYPDMTKNDAVKLLQQFLIDNGLLNSRVDGDFGKKTVEAVKAYQLSMGYEATGVAFPQTLNVLFCTINGAMTNNPHVYGDWTILTEALSNAPGRRSHACLYCGFTAEEAYDPAGTLRPGLEKDAGVKELQKMLIDKGIIKTIADGNYGPRTELGVSTFQQMAGLEVTGVAYPETIEALRSWTGK